MMKRWFISCGLFAACYALDKKSDISTRAVQFYNEKKLILWSKDGSDFVGPVTFDQGYASLKWKKFESPDGLMCIRVFPNDICIETRNGLAYSYKILYHDGNTKVYVEGFDSKRTFHAIWDESGNMTESH